MIRTQIQLTEEQAQRVKRIAMKRGISIAELIREAVDRLPEDGSGTRRERAIAAVGGFRSGMKDVSEKHDLHLVDAYEE